MPTAVGGGALNDSAIRPSVCPSVCPMAQLLYAIDTLAACSYAMCGLQTALLLSVHCSVFTARRYAGAVYAVVVCLSVRPSVRPSQSGIVSNDWTNRAGLQNAGFFLLIPAETCVSPQLGYFSQELRPKLRT